MLKTKDLPVFVRYECANYYKKLCITDKPCKVEQGKRCKYFEKCVLTYPEYRYKPFGYDYGKILAQYKEQTACHVAEKGSDVHQNCRTR